MAGKAVRLGSLKRGDYFTLCDHDGEDILYPSIVWVRDVYDRSTRKYICLHFDNIGRSRQFEASTPVYTGFIF